MVAQHRGADVRPTWAGAPAAGVPAPAALGLPAVGHGPGAAGLPGASPSAQAPSGTNNGDIEKGTAAVSAALIALGAPPRTGKAGGVTGRSAAGPGRRPWRPARARRAGAPPGAKAATAGATWPTTAAGWPRWRAGRRAAGAAAGPGGRARGALRPATAARATPPVPTPPLAAARSPAASQLHCSSRELRQAPLRTKFLISATEPQTHQQMITTTHVIFHPNTIFLQPGDIFFQFVYTFPIIFPKILSIFLQIKI